MKKLILTNNIFDVNVLIFFNELVKKQKLINKLQ